MAGVIQKWKTSPPGPAHLNLIQLFKDKTVKSEDTAQKFWKTDPEWARFSLATFRGYVNKQKHAHGLTLSNEVEDDSLCASGPSGSSKRLRSSTLTDDTEEKDLESRDLQIVHHNQPALVTVYKDPETQQEKVFILISLPGGSTEVEFSLVGNGPGSSTAHIKHSWPPVMFDIDSLFGKVSIRNEKISEFHPKIVALKTEFENNRDSVAAIPQAVIDIPLPIPVQTAKASYQFIGGKKPDGSMFVIADLTAYQSSYTVKKSDMKVTFVEIDKVRMLSCQVWKRSKISIRDNMPEINTALLWSFIFN